MKNKHALMSLCRFVEVLVVGPPMKLCMEIFVKEGVRVGKFENLKIFLQKIYLKFFIKYLSKQELQYYNKIQNILPPFSSLHGN